jgi:hypothetical protein
MVEQLKGLPDHFRAQPFANRNLLRNTQVYVDRPFLQERIATDYVDRNVWRTCVSIRWTHREAPVTWAQLAADSLLR